MLNIFFVSFPSVCPVCEVIDWKTRGLREAFDSSPIPKLECDKGIRQLLKTH